MIGFVKIDSCKGIKSHDDLLILVLEEWKVVRNDG